MSKKGWALFGGAIALSPLVYMGLAKKRFDSLFAPTRDRDITECCPDNSASDIYKSTLLDDLTWLRSKNHEDMVYKSYDGKELYALRIKSHDAHQVVILHHATKADHYAVVHQARIFDALGYDTILVDQRAHGRSEGDYTSLGFKEAIDLARLVDILKKEDPNIKIGLYGISLGAMTVMMYLAQKVSENIIFVIEEGGFINAKTQIYRSFKDKTLAFGIDQLYRKWMTSKLEDIDALKAIRGARVPILFLHSQYDEVVDVKEAKELFDAYEGPKDIHIFKTKTRLGAYLLEEYPKVIENFIKTL